MTCRTFQYFSAGGWRASEDRLLISGANAAGVRMRRGANAMGVLTNSDAYEVYLHQSGVG